MFRERKILYFSEKPRLSNTATNFTVNFFSPVHKEFCDKNIQGRLTVISHVYIKHTLHTLVKPVQDFFLKSFEGETLSWVNGGISLLRNVPDLPDSLLSEPLERGGGGGGGE